MILDWRNSDIVVTNSINKCIIKWIDHLEFVKSLKNASDRAYFLISDSVKAIGVISFTNIDEKSADVGYYKDPLNHDKGVGAALLNFACEIAKGTLNLKELIAKVIGGNSASEKSMERSGFVYFKDENVTSGKEFIILKVYKKKILSDR